MTIYIWNQDDIKRILLAIIEARKPLTNEEKVILQAMAVAFGLDISKALK